MSLDHEIKVAPIDSILSTKWRPDLGVTGNISQSIIGEYIRAIREEFHDL